MHEFIHCLRKSLNLSRPLSCRSHRLRR